MRDQQCGRARHVGQGTDQLGGHAHRHQVQAGERFVVHDQFGVQRDCAGQRHPARHATGDFADLQARRATQAHGVELHQHDVADQLFRQVGHFPQRERDVVEDIQVGEQRPELEQHPESPAQPEQLSLVGRVDYLPVEHHAPAAGGVHAADQAQQCRFPTAGATQHGRDLAAGELQGDVVEDGPAAVVAEGDMVDVNERGIAHESKSVTSHCRMHADNNCPTNGDAPRFIAAGRSAPSGTRPPPVPPAAPL